VIVIAFFFNFTVFWSTDMSLNVDENGTMRSTLLKVAETHHNKFKVIHINAQSLHNSLHYAEFCDIFTNSNIDVIGVSETFFQANSKTVLPNYQAFFVNRCSRRGGGVALYVHNRLKARLLATSNGEALRPEFVIVEVKCDNESILVSCVYRPPKVGFLDTYLDELYYFLPQYKYSTICGDFNARFGSGSHETQLVTELFELCDHSCIPYSATFKTDNSSSILDVIATNCQEYVIEHGQCVAPGFSCHDLIYAVLNLRVPPVKKKLITFRDFSKIDEASLLMDANDVPWENIYKLVNIDSKVQLLNEYILKLLDKHAPVKTIKVKENEPPWMNNEIRSMLNKRDKARDASLKSKNLCDKEVYVSLRNKAKQECRNAKMRYYHGIFDGDKSTSKMWATIRSMGMGKARQGCHQFPISANELNAHYLNVSKIEDKDLASETEAFYEKKDCDTAFDNLLHFKFVPAHDIYKTIMNFKSNAVGVDGISLKFVKIILSAITFVLEHVMNYCLQSGVFPSLWKRANVLPLPKTSNPLHCADFRPVSILCLFAKVLEKLAHDQMYDYVASRGLINPLQSGFRKGHSTTTALVKVADDIRKAIDERKLTLLVLLDFSKAFDRVNHKLLLIKLKKLGFSWSVIKWLSDYLSHRFQRVRSGDEFTSDWAPVETGVPQGSVLGPLLFILYLHDISSVLLYSKYHLYADDTQLYIDFLATNLDVAVSRINADLCNLVKYISSHNLYLNVSKTQPIIIGSGYYVNLLKESNVPLVTISGVSVPYCEEVTNLGVTFDTTLSWRQHTNNVVRKVFGTLAQARRNFVCLPSSIRLRIVQCLVMPIVDYGSVLFSDMNKGTTNKIQKAENACIRFVTNAKRFEHITPHYVELGLLKITERRTLALAIFTWKILKCRSPLYLAEMFKFSSRHPDLILIPQHRTEKYARSFCIAASRAFNVMDGHKFLNMLNPSSFKKCIKSQLKAMYC